MFKTKKHHINRCLPLLTAVLCAGSLSLMPALQVHAASAIELRLEEQRAMPVQSNQVPDWPVGPIIGAESAILIEMETGTILYSKNIHQHQYPASTTKILTALIASERCQLDEIVSFSYNAVFDTPRDSTHIAMDVGQELTMDQCLQALLIRSANEVAYAIAEHISGSTDWQVFGDIMNERAEELGCLNTHFANPNGLPDENHYTTAYDLAMIGRAFFSNEMLCQTTLAPRFEFPATDNLPETKIENNLMKLLPGREYAYQYLVGCKTGYTNAARSCLVACAERNGMKLISVVLHDEAPYQYEDTISLLDYGFANFEKVNIAQTETKYNIEDAGLFYSGNDIFGSSRPLLTLDKNDFLILPRTISFQDLDSTVSYQTGNENQAAIISYSYGGVDLGFVRVNFAADNDKPFAFETLPTESETEEDSSKNDGIPTIFINIAQVFGILAAIVCVLLVILFIRLILKNYAFSGRSHYRRKRRRRRRSFRRTRWLDD